ncbi:hypothetical protein [Methanobrevibacter sp. DSM 116169]|uniref:hypothetical protein n=1 Tax=Methanobrevibacter sp. DSM 116169 TaxID=3242727 RepID=UPI0038FCE3C7
MINKKRFLSLFIIILLFSISSISAEEIDSIDIENNEYIDDVDEINENSETFDSAIVGEGNFSLLHRVIVHVGDNGVIYMEGNITLDDGEESTYYNGLEIQFDNLTIIGNGHTINGLEKVRIFHITGNNVTLINLTLTNGFTPYIEDYDYSGGAIFNEGDYLQLIYTTLTYNSAYYGGAIFNTGNNVIINNSKFNDNKAYDGGAIYNLGGTTIGNNNGNNFTICENTNISFNTAKRNGGGIYNYNGNNFLIYKNNVIVENLAEANGGGIYNGFATQQDQYFFSFSTNINTENNALTIYDNNVISNNIAYEDGGGIYLDSRVTESDKKYNVLISKNNEISFNSASNGAGIYSTINLYRASFNLTIDNGNNISNNNASDNGGGIYFQYSAYEDITDFNIKISNNNIINSNNASYGGGLYFTGTISQNSNLNISIINGNDLSDNNAFDGGAIYYNYESSNDEGYINYLISNSNSFNNNYAENNGGAIYNNIRSYGDYLLIDYLINGSNVFTNNIADENGGAIYNNIDYEFVNFLINGTNLFSENFANNGGAIYNFYSDIEIINGIFESNNAFENGGAIYNDYGDVGLIDVNFNDNFALNGGAIYNLGYYDRYDDDYLGKIFILNSNFTNNIADENGGAIFNNGFMEIDNILFEDNLANLNGGAIYNNGFEDQYNDHYSELYIYESKFLNNNAINGSAIYNNDFCDLLIYDSIFNGTSYLIYNNGNNDTGDYAWLYLENNTMSSDSVAKIYNLGLIESETHVIMINNRTKIVELGSENKIYGQITDDNGNIIVGQGLEIWIENPNGSNYNYDFVTDFIDGYYYAENLFIPSEEGAYIIDGIYFGSNSNYQINDFAILNSVEYKLNISKEVNTELVNIGDYITYNVTITNDGVENATNITVYDYYTDDLIFVNILEDYWVETSKGVFVYYGTLEPGETIFLTLIFKVSETANPVINNTVNVTSKQFPFGRNATSNNTNVTYVDLEITKSTDIKSVNIGDTISYTIIVSNVGSDNATGVVITDYIPEGLTYIGFEGFGWKYDIDIKNWYYNDTLASGESTELVLKFIVNRNATRLLNNTANVASNESKTGKNVTSNNTNVTFVEFNITKITDSKVVNIGEYINYTIFITNIGLDNATSIILTEYIPKGLTLVYFDGRGWTYDLDTLKWYYNDTLASGESVNITLFFLVNGNATRFLNNTVNVASNESKTGKNATSNNTNITFVEFNITKITTSENVKVGDSINYTISITNIGSDNATGVILSDYIPNGLIYVDFEGSDWSYNNITGKWYYNGTLAIGDTTEIILLFTINNKASPILNNTVNVASYERPTGQEATSNNVNVTGIKTEITVENVTGKPGETVTIEGTVTNENGDLINGKVTITLPDGTEVITDLIDGEYSYNWTIPEDMAPGEKDFKVEFKGDDNYEPSDVNGIATIEKLETTIILDDVSGKPGETVPITGQVIDENGNPVKEGKITLTLPDGSQVTVDVIDGTFIYYWTIPKDFKKGDYYIYAEFSSDLYEPSNATGILSVISDPTPGPTPTPVDDDTDSEILIDETLDKTGNPIAILILALIFCLILPLKRRF